MSAFTHLVCFYSALIFCLDSKHEIRVSCEVKVRGKHSVWRGRILVGNITEISNQFPECVVELNKIRSLMILKLIHKRSFRVKLLFLAKLQSR